MKISLSNPGFWLRCLFEFIFCSCVCFIMVMKCWIKIVCNGFEWKEEKNGKEGRGVQLHVIDKTLKDIEPGLSLP